MKKLSVLVLMLSCSLFFGCSAKIKVAQNVPVDFDTHGQVTQNSLSNPSVTSEQTTAISIDENDFAVGLKNAMEMAGLFGKTDPSYRIEAKIKHLEYPNFGLEFNAKMYVDYMLYDPAGKMVAEKELVSEGNCPAGEHFVAAVRLQRAIERSSTEQFKLAVNFISESVKQAELQNPAAAPAQVNRID